MKVVICDDNPIVLNEVKSMIEEYSINKNIIFDIDVFENGSDLLNSNNYYNIAILDVEMPEINGIELAKQLRNKNSQIILMFLTAYHQYIDNAFDLNAARFFEKPLNKERFFLGLNNVLQKIDESQIELFLKDSEKRIRVSANDIIYLEIFKRGTKIITINRIYESNNKIDYYKNKLVKSVFVSPHKSFLINLNYLKSYKRNSLTLTNDIEIPISHNKQADFRKAFFKYLGDR